MKFGQQLRDSMFPDWRFYYVDYARLKKFIKARMESGFTESDERSFVEMLERELEKVYSFHEVKVGETKRHVQYCQERLASMQRDSSTSDADYADMEDEINQIIQEFNQLSHFTRLNYSAFIKIIKKHDKHSHYVLKPMFMVRLNARPFFKENFEPLLLNLSRMYDVVRHGGKPSYDASKGQASGAQNFVRQTTKYWVHPDNVMELKLYVLRYLPVLVYNSKGGNGDEPVNPAITSIYFDNDEFELYQGRLEKTEGAQAIRLRWYGPNANPEIFVERKTHREDWTGEKSVKERFAIKEKNVNAYLKGEYTMERAVEKMRERGTKSEKELEGLATLSSEIQSTIAQKQLHPVIRSFYNRTAFQLPGDARVRISLDTELCMVREDNYDGVQRSGSNWRRTDIDTQYPFPDIDDADICRFPYAVLEVKLQTHVGAEPPEWVTRLVNSGLVESVPKFSKYIHGVSTLLESRIQLFPFWLPQMDRDIRYKKAALPTSQSRESLLHGSSRLSETSRNSSTHDHLATSANQADVRITMHSPSEPSDQGDDRVTDSSRRKATRQARRRRGSADSRRRASRRLTSHSGLHDDTVNEESSPLLGRPDDNRSQSRSLFQWPRWFRRQHGYESMDASTMAAAGPSEAGPSPRSSYGTTGTRLSFTAQHQPGKRIAIPVRVEPKVFFANERTFLSWLNFSVVLGSLALGLLNFGDAIGRISGAIFTLISMAAMVYALFVYQWRAQKIRNREAGPYDDRMGPTLLVLVLFLAVVINFYLKFST
ncbi:hypothetical protein H4R34_000506 [Dimargaris verticillata]|uniref:Vacuolar transporter chaperone complex subunit 4 n=1 Tax=Dimargaris verticillata TaxID=2761393 RepID=A0A9W8EFV1_9FUNG|nr:hypothetical protein H4R34_000506 [Dimargaris verticillata]